MCETIIAEFERLEQHRQKLLLPVLLSALVKFQRPRTQDALKAIKRTMDQGWLFPQVVDIYRSGSVEEGEACVVVAATLDELGA